MRFFITTVCILLNILISYNSFAQYAIGNRDTTLIDVSRSSRSIQAYFYYPATTAGTGVAVATPPIGGFPVVVVAHGFSMDYAAFTNFKDSLVPKGYIVIIPNTETGIIGISHGNFGGDLSFLVNYMQLQNSNITSRYFGKVRNKSAIIGHSMGGGATYLGANGNANVTTTVTFGAAETSPSAVTACAGISVPSLVFVGQNDCVAPASTNQTLMYNALASSCKTKITIHNGGHCQYSNSSFTCDFGEGTCRGTSTILTRAQQQPIVFDYLYKWLDFYLRGNCLAYTSFQNLLTTDSRISYAQSCSNSLPVATIYNADANLKCSEDSVHLYSLIAYPSYLWSNSITDSSIITTTAGNYFLVVTDNVGCKDTSNIISITNRLPNRATITPSGTLNTCGSIPNITINASGTLLNNYVWNTGDTGTTTLADTLGLYYVQTSDINNCLANSDTLQVISLSAIIPSIHPSDTVYFCPKDSVIFSITPAFTTYNWSDSSTNDHYIAYETESVYMSTIDSNGCNAYSDTIYVIKYPETIPTIIHHIDSLEADTGYLSYSWYDDVNNLLSTDRIFFPTENARVFVLKVVDKNGCRSDAVASLFSFSVGLNSYRTFKINIVPNPFTNKLFISNLEKNSKINIIDNSGREIFNVENIMNPFFEINTSDFKNGFYILKVNSSIHEQYYKLIK